jgi:hypothetical protein
MLVVPTFEEEGSDLLPMFLSIPIQLVQQGSKMRGTPHVGSNVLHI